MKELILKKIREIELEKGVEILYAVESGSRAWGFASPDSDYDIRFIYKHDLNYYLSIWEKTDVIEFMTDEDLDGSGWDIRKALLLLAKSNAPFLEWIYSPIVYFENKDFIDELRKVANECFSPVSCMYHYIGTTKNFLEVCEKEQVKLKSYFYALRTVLSGMWIVKMNSFPPVAFMELLDIAPKKIKEKVITLMDIKASQDESYLHPKEEIITNFIKETLTFNIENATSLANSKRDNFKLDEIFKKIILNK
ncbi:nucleotidyltransferase domain-containing protein [Flavobacterium sp. TP390]|uniref:Nucleotidyltransferase domain-containing protein n=2 Tax=Flavobacterium profundi TaxID=1774945 RepID=A0A6I4ILA5_9FLAO|nr:nucleotidyltransferase domain-containing protein [Flavobacterium profundi]